MDSSDVLRVAGLERESIVDGPGVRFTVFAQGCPHACPGCHNPQTHPPEGGEPMDIHGIFRNMAQNPLLRGVTFSGGEPFMQAKPLARLGEMAHGIHLDVVTYSGYTYEQILEGATPQNGWGDLLAQTDWLIDGPFLIGQKSLDLAFRGSRNQRIIDVAASAKEGRAVEIQGFSPRRRGRAPAGK